MKPLEVLGVMGASSLHFSGILPSLRWLEPRNAVATISEGTENEHTSSESSP